MSKIRVLLVDDSVVIRKIIGDLLGDDPDLVVVGNAGNGRVALDMIPKVNPDIVILDVEMPELNGIRTLVEVAVARGRYSVDDLDARQAREVPTDSGTAAALRTSP